MNVVKIQTKYYRLNFTFIMLLYGIKNFKSYVNIA